MPALIKIARIMFRLRALLLGDKVQCSLPLVSTQEEKLIYHFMLVSAFLVLIIQIAVGLYL